MSESSLDKLDRLASILERLEGVMDKIPRIAELLGVVVLAGRASEKLGGSFVDGAVGGAVADGLVHSNLPHNQIGGVALGSYFTALGILNVVPSGISFGDDAPEGFDDRVMTEVDCENAGGEIVNTMPGSPLILCRIRI